MAVARVGAAALAVAAVLAVRFMPSANLAGPVSAQDRCANAAIRAPLTGESLRGNVPVLGSARIDDFNFYKVEWAPAADPEGWRAVSDTKNEPVLNGLLDQWNTETVSDGSYRLKLTVVDGLYQEVCRVVVPGLVVANQAEPTATPTEFAVSIATAAPEEMAAEAEAETDEAPVEPTPTLAPIIPAGDASEPEDIFDPGTWLDLLQVGEWVQAFLQGFVAGWAIAVLFLLVQFLRRPR